MRPFTTLADSTLKTVKGLVLSIVLLIEVKLATGSALQYQK